MVWTRTNRSIGAWISVLGSLFVIRHTLQERELGQSERTLRFSPAIRWLALSDMIFEVTYVLYLSLLDVPDPWCAFQNFFWQFSATCTWLWTNVIALFTMSVLLRLEDRQRTIVRWQHSVWVLGAISAAPNIWESRLGDPDPSDGHRYCDDFGKLHMWSNAFLIISFIVNSHAYVSGLLRASRFMPFSVLERYAYRMFFFLGIFALCWMPYLFWNWYDWFHGSSPGEGTALFDITIVLQPLQGALNAIVYGFFDSEVRRHCPCCFCWADTRRLESLSATNSRAGSAATSAANSLANSSEDEQESEDADSRVSRHVAFVTDVEVMRESGTLLKQPLRSGHGASPRAALMPVFCLTFILISFFCFMLALLVYY